VNVDNNFSSMDSVVTALLMRLLRELIWQWQTEVWTGPVMFARDLPVQ
jgi:hypothetical protein